MIHPGCRHCHAHAQPATILHHEKPGWRSGFKNLRGLTFVSVSAVSREVMTRRNRDWSTVLWACASVIVISFLCIWAVKTWQRVIFPWDLYVWPESPFLTNMLKLERRLPVFSSPADGNSFVYSPGLEYLCFGLLKPFGLELDIRFCRLVSILMAALGAGFAGLAIKRVVYPGAPAGQRKGFFLVSAGAVFLVISKNFLADVAHPDNLHTGHALLVFWLCFTAGETRRFGVALGAMVVGGLGVFAKQTEASAVFGAALYFAVWNPWGWKHWFVLLATGIGILGISLYALWLPEYARFYTLELPSRHGIVLLKIRGLAHFFWRLDGGLMPLLCVLAMCFFWQAGGITRRYLVCWSVIGCFAVTPALAAFLKAEGEVNNLALFRTWMLLLVWPFFGRLLALLRSEKITLQEIPIPRRRAIQITLGLVIVLSLLWLLPIKQPPVTAHYEYAGAIENSLRTDMHAGRSVLVAHGTSALIHCGATTVPLDRANSILELNTGKLGGLAGMSARIQSRSYDRIYLTVSAWYGQELEAEIASNYVEESVIKMNLVNPPKLAQGFQPEIMWDCHILKPRN